MCTRKTLNPRPDRKAHPGAAVRRGRRSMIRPVAVAAACFLLGSSVGGGADAAPVSEATVEKACGDDIQGGCAGSQCAMGCERREGGKLVTYGCTFPNKTGKTKATCSKTVLRPGRDRGGNRAAARKPSVLKAN